MFAKSGVRTHACNCTSDPKSNALTTRPPGFYKQILVILIFRLFQKSDTSHRRGHQVVFDKRDSPRHAGPALSPKELLSKKIYIPNTPLRPQTSLFATKHPFSPQTPLFTRQTPLSPHGQHLIICAPNIPLYPGTPFYPQHTCSPQSTPLYP